MSLIKVVSTGDQTFLARLKKMMNRQPEAQKGLVRAVAGIIDQVKRKGDAGLVALTEKYDGIRLQPEKILASPQEIKAAANKVTRQQKRCLNLAASRIEAFHRRFKLESWMAPGEEGEMIGHLIRPLQRVGVYVPGGKASYPSSVLMNVLPARIAGVPEVVLCTPPGRDGGLDPYVAAAAQICQVDKLARIGGAQAIAAMAYGTASVPKVDKIVGPGNVYVTLAKKQVFGQVDIDLLAGPSEILILADEGAAPGFLAADLLSQAEHDEKAWCILVTPSETLAQEVVKAAEFRLADLPSKAIAKKTLENQGAAIVTRDLKEGVGLVNLLAFEHLEIVTQEPWEILPRITNAGAIFLGPYTPEAVGDYLAGPNHTLPTGGTARFFSPVTVGDFLKGTSVISFGAKSLAALRRPLTTLARMEGLFAHALAVEERFR